MRKGKKLHSLFLPFLSFPACMTAATTLVVLAELFDRHGPPLVLKSDNGSAFNSQPLYELLASRAVLWLPSPLRTPRYNGSCEAGIGQMQDKKRAASRMARELF